MTQCAKVGVCVCKCECVGVRAVAWEPKSTHTFYVEDINAKAGYNFLLSGLINFRIGSRTLVRIPGRKFTKL